MGAMAVAGGYTAFNQVQQGKAENANYQYLADQSIQQGQLALDTADRNISFAQDAGARDTRTVKQNAEQVAARQKATMAANGIGLDSVTAQDISSDTFDRSTLDVLAVKYNTDIKSWELLNNAKFDNWNAKNAADEYRFAGKSAKRTGKINAFGTILGTAASMAMAGSMAKKPPPAGMQTSSGPISFLRPKTF